jgi:hypothetical protein
MTSLPIIYVRDDEHRTLCVNGPTPISECLLGLKLLLSCPVHLCWKARMTSEDPLDLTGVDRRREDRKKMKALRASIRKPAVDFHAREDSHIRAILRGPRERARVPTLHVVRNADYVEMRTQFGEEVAHSGLAGEARSVIVRSVSVLTVRPIVAVWGVHVKSGPLEEGGLLNALVEIPIEPLVLVLRLVHSPPRQYSRSRTVDAVLWPQSDLRRGQYNVPWRLSKPSNGRAAGVRCCRGAWRAVTMTAVHWSI